MTIETRHVALSGNEGEIEPMHERISTQAWRASTAACHYHSETVRLESLFAKSHARPTDYIQTKITP
jgi:hypothetical protein